MCLEWHELSQSITLSLLSFCASEPKTKDYFYNYFGLIKLAIPLPRHSNIDMTLLKITHITSNFFSLKKEQTLSPWDRQFLFSQVVSDCSIGWLISSYRLVLYKDHLH